MMSCMLVRMATPWIASTSSATLVRMHVFSTVCLARLADVYRHVDVYKLQEEQSDWHQACAHGRKVEVPCSTDSTLVG